MARYAYEGYTVARWVTTLSSTSSPTATQINAGVDITPFLPKDALNPNASQNMVDSATIAETYDSQVVGSWRTEWELVGFRDNSADTFWDLAVYGTLGFLVIRRGIAVATAIAATQKVEVYPAQMHQPVPRPSGANEQTRFTLKLATTSAPNLKATVA